MVLDQGIPYVDKYTQLLEHYSFQDMEKFSDNFLNSNNDNLKDYSKKWVKDPLHQWSRQWEYPFVYSFKKIR